MRDTRFDPWVGKILWRREWQPTLVFLPGEFHGQRSLAGHSPRSRKELDTTKQLHSLTETYPPLFLFLRAFDCIGVPWSSWEGLVCAGWHTPLFPIVVLHYPILRTWSSLTMNTFRATNLKLFPPLNSVWISHMLNLKFLRHHKGLISSSLIEIILPTVITVTKQRTGPPGNKVKPSRRNLKQNQQSDRDIEGYWVAESWGEEKFPNFHLYYLIQYKNCALLGLGRSIC